MTENPSIFRRPPECGRARRVNTVRLLLLPLLLVLLAGTPVAADTVQADAADFTLDTTGTAAGTGGTAHADSADFTLNTLSPTDSVDFTLDTTDGALGVGGTVHADSVDFTLDTTNVVAGTGGVAQADSADFTLDTTSQTAGTGGTTYRDSADFTLNTLAPTDSADFTLDTTGLTVGMGGTVHADSADFTLNTTGIDPRSLDIGLRVFDGTAIIKLGAEPGTPASPLRIHKNGTTYGIQLVDPNAPDASKIRIQTPSGVKALQKVP